MIDNMCKEDLVLASLKAPSTIRKQSHKILQMAKENKLQHFSFHAERLEPTAAFVIEVIKQNYPKLNVPYHSRLRHFEADNSFRIEQLLTSMNSLTEAARGTILYELIIISVFLDAGAGNQWRYVDKSTNKVYSRSEGLALASLAMYQEGAFSADLHNPYRVDAAKLVAFTAQDLYDGFQVSADNLLEGIAGRVDLLNQLGKIIQNKPECFGAQGRLGDFYSYVYSLQTNHKLTATTLFQAVLQTFNNVWPKRLSFQGIPLGDVWTHPLLKTKNLGSEYIPFHKLSQWLTYSLIEPLEQAGIQVTQLDELTGLPEYRNGGLLIDMGLICAKKTDIFTNPQDPGSEVIIEWRALTVALLDEIAVLIRQKLQLDAKSLPLAKILQGGTWAAGRIIAKEKRPNGAPPIQIISDGTLF